jgi:hypothetical protein
MDIYCISFLYILHVAFLTGQRIDNWEQMVVELWEDMIGTRWMGIDKV